jgi:hypothetical protein
MIPIQNILSYFENLLTAGMVWKGAIIFLALVVIISLVILWHWTKYGVGFLRKAGVEVAFISITGFLVVLFIISVIRLGSLL